MSNSHVVATGEALVVTNAASNATLFSPSLIGFLCTASSSGTLTVTDSPQSAGSRTLISAMAIVAGNWYPCPVNCKGTVTISIPGGTGTVMAVYSPS